MKLRPTEYQFKEQEDSSEKSAGFIAQEVIKLFPSVVKIMQDDTNGKGIDNLHTITYSELIPYLVKGMQEQQLEIDALKKDVAEIKALLKQE